MSYKDADADDVEESPHFACTVKELKFELVNVANWNGRNTHVPSPEKLKVRNAVPADEHRRRTDEILIGGAEAELEQVDRHECKERHTRDCKIHRREQARAFNHFLLVPRTHQTDKDVEKSTQQDVFLYNVRRETKTGPIKPHIKVAISVEIIRAHKHVQVADCMDHLEEHEKNCRSCEPFAITADLDILTKTSENCCADFVKNGQPQTPESMEVRLDVEKEDAWIVVIALPSPILRA
mmetsp:Transcript_44394/g.69220  ORF Transcript_44394/g.69220 Transcript_44394/m.69220 type:complete len:238 (-) Transcript_44394:661-1374(-)